jgi:hypothetical protein
VTTIKVPLVVAEQLRNAAQLACLVDEQGNVLGSFIPAGPPDELTPDELAEIKRRMQSPGPWYTTQQVLAYLDSLGGNCKWLKLH